MLLSAHATAAMGQPSLGQPHVGTRPHNVVVLVADDVGVDLIGAYEGFFDNHPDPAYPNQTPVVDHLAATGMLFRNCWTNPLCSPSRAQMLTGRHAQRNGIGTVFVAGDDHRLGLQPHIPTLPGVLRSPQSPIPYRTAAVGKWHLSDPNQIVHGQKSHALGEDHAPWFHLWAGAEHNIHQTHTYNSWHKTFATPIDRFTDECTPSPPTPCVATVHDYATRDTVDDAVHLIETLPEPFFLWVAFNAVHKPLGPPATALAASGCAGIMGNPTCASSFDGTNEPADVRCMMQWLDNEIGRVVCAVESSSGSPELPTTLVFIGDNGTRGTKLAFTTGGIAPPFHPKHGKGTLYEGGIHVPLIVKSPLIPSPLRGSVHEALVNSTDLFATVVELTMSVAPDDPARDSVSLVPYLTGATGSKRAYAYAELFKPGFSPGPDGTPPAWHQPDFHWRAIRDVAGFKLMQRVTPDGFGGLEFKEEFYDLNADPHEANDLIGLVGAPPLLEPYVKLRGQLGQTYPHLVKP